MKMEEEKRLERKISLGLLLKAPELEHQILL
jgi:hypothetical protein